MSLVLFALALAARAEVPPDSPAPVEVPAEPSEGEDPAPSEGEASEEPGGEEPAELAPPDEAALAPPDLGGPSEPAEPAEPPKNPVTLLFSEDFELRLWQMPNRLPDFPDSHVLDYVEEVNRLTANLRYKSLSAYAQLDQVALMANSYYLDDVRTPERDLMLPGTFSPLLPGTFDPTTQGMSGWDLIGRNLYVNLEKLRVSYEKGPISVHFGDTYAAFGRGLALNLNRNVDIDIDTSLQGVKFQARPGSWDVTAVVAQANRQQVFQDNPNRGLFGDRRHFVSGVRVEKWGLGKANLGAHGVMYSFADDQGWKNGFRAMGQTPDAVVGGANLELIGLGPVDLYMEGDGFAYPTSDLWGGDQQKPGYALYGSMGIYAGRTTWLVEAKRYYQTQRLNSSLAPELYQIAIGPSLEYERQITEDSAAALGSNDVISGRVRMDVAAIPGVLTPYVQMMVTRDADLAGLHFNRVPETIYHPMVGLQLTKDAWSVMFNAGHRFDVRDGSEFGMDKHLHGDVLARLPVVKDWYVDVAVAAEWYRWGRNALQQDDYVEMESAFTVQKGSLVALTWFTDYSSNPLISSTGNLSKTVYGAAELQIQPLPALTIKAFYGAYKSGIRCSGGQCRVLPGFEGARVSLVASF
jgi:hypothetical protein